MLNEAIIQELQQILKEDYGKNLEKEEAFEIANTLVNYFDLLAKINSRTDNKQLNNKDKYENKRISN